MKISEQTLSVLKNFATINSGVVLRQGKVQKTISPEKSILVEAVLEDEIPSEFGIYDLNQFLGNVTTLDSPDVEFAEKSAILKDDNFVLTYHSCLPTLIITPPNKELLLKSVDVTFKLTSSTLSKLLKIATMNGFSNLSVVGKDGGLFLKVHEKSNDTSNHGNVRIGDYAGKDFIATFRKEDLKLLPDDYDVELQIGAFAKFVNEKKTLTYFISLDTK